MFAESWSDLFLDLDPASGIATGDRKERALNEAARRCKAVLFLISKARLRSKWCNDEYQLDVPHNTPLFSLLVDAIALDRLAGDMVAQWQIFRLRSVPAWRVITVHPDTRQQSPIHIREAALINLKRRFPPILGQVLGGI